MPEEAVTQPCEKTLYDRTVSGPTGHRNVEDRHRARTKMSHTGSSGVCFLSIGHHPLPGAGTEDQAAMGVEWMISSLGLFVEAPPWVTLFVSPCVVSRAVQV